jgi:hypothetical protein
MPSAGAARPRQRAGGAAIEPRVPACLPSQHCPAGPGPHAGSTACCSRGWRRKAQSTAARSSGACAPTPPPSAQPWLGLAPSPLLQAAARRLGGSPAPAPQQGAQDLISVAPPCRSMSLDILIAQKYRLGRKLGGGSFGEIYLGTNLQTGEEVGIKLVSAASAPLAAGRAQRLAPQARGGARRPRGVRGRVAEGRGGSAARRLLLAVAARGQAPTPQCRLHVCCRSRSRLDIRSCCTSPSCTKSCREEVRGGGGLLA